MVPLEKTTEELLLIYKKRLPRQGIVDADIKNVGGKKSIKLHFDSGKKLFLPENFFRKTMMLFLERQAKN